MRKQISADDAHSDFEIARLEHKKKYNLTKLKQSDFLMILIDSHKKLEDLKGGIK